VPPSEGKCSTIGSNAGEMGGDEPGFRSVDNIAGQAREIVLDGEIAVSDHRGVTHIDDRQDAIAGHGPG
jgi:hypothetical protein